MHRGYIADDGRADTELKKTKFTSVWLKDKKIWKKKIKINRTHGRNTAKAFGCARAEKS